MSNLLRYPEVREMQANGETIRYTTEVLPIGMQLWPVKNAVETWLQQITFDELVELYWQAQARKADKLEAKR